MNRFMDCAVRGARPKPMSLYPLNILSLPSSSSGTPRPTGPLHAIAFVLQSNILRGQQTFTQQGSQLMLKQAAILCGVGSTVVRIKLAPLHYPVLQIGDINLCR
jgi:hypothetical protein